MKTVSRQQCAVDGCQRQLYCRGYCELHYRRVRRSGSTDLPPRLVHQPSPCSIEDCAAPHWARGLCATHYKQWWISTKGHTRAKCAVAWCARRAVARGLCSTHYDRWNKGGDPHTKSIKELTPEARFWSFVDRRGLDECWLWQGGTGYPPGDYGHLKVGGRTERAHVFSYRLHHGSIPRGMVVCHACDTPRCVNPSHLWLGTQMDNVRDRNTKGRTAQIPQKLTAGDARTIRARYAEGGITMSALAREYAVSPQSIRAVVRRETWRHVD